MANELVLRVILDDGTIDKITVPKPQTLLELYKQIEDKCNIENVAADYNMFYTDIDFNNAEFSLKNIEDIVNKCTLRLVKKAVAGPSGLLAESMVPATGHSVTMPSATESPTKNIRREMWPKVFVLPNFKPETAVYLRKQNDIVSNGGKVEKFPRNVKEHILDRLSEEIYKYSLRPDLSQRCAVAKELVCAYPCLKIPGTEEGWEGWEKSIYWRMAHLRARLRDDEEELSGTRGRVSKNNALGKPAKLGFTKPSKRGAINDKPNFPRALGAADLETHRVRLITLYQVEEYMSKEAKELMSLTFALRRREIKEKRLIKDILERWPMLKHETHIVSDFQRITDADAGLVATEILQHADRLLVILAGRTGKQRQEIQKHLVVLKLQEENGVVANVDVKLRCLILALTAYFGEDEDNIYKTVPAELGLPDSRELKDLDMQGLSVLVLGVNDGDEILQYAVASENFIVNDDIATFMTAFTVAFTMHYVFDLIYTAKANTVWEFIQKVIIGLDNKKLSNKLQAIKTRMCQ